MSVVINGDTGISGVNGSAAIPALQGGDADTGIFFGAANTLSVSTAAQNRVFVGTTGRIGLNNNLTPQYQVHIKSNNSSSSERIDVHMTNDTTGHGGDAGVQFGYQNVQGAYIWNFENVPTYFGVNNDEKLRILPTGGITFNGDSASTNALDDYEEGSWTVTLVRQSSQPTVTYSRQHAKYTKIGNQVLVWWDMIVDTNTGGAGYYAIGGLPFGATTASDGGGYGAPQFRSHVLLDTNCRLYGNSSYHISNTIPLYCFNSSGVEVQATATTGRITGWSVYNTSA